MPLPGPVWLMMTLLLVTFLLHIIAMNLTLGGTRNRSHVRGPAQAR